MAAVIGEFVGDHSRFHNTIGSSAPSYERSHTGESEYRSKSRPRDIPTQRSRSPASSPRYRQTTPTKRTWDAVEADQEPTSTGGASRFPTPDSSSPNPSSTRAAPQHGKRSSPYMASDSQQTASAATTNATISAPPSARQQPSPASDGFGSLPRSSSFNTSLQSKGQTIVVRDLAHIQSLAQKDLVNAGNGPGILNDPPLHAMKYEISGMPIGDIIEMVAALLTKITTTNDLQHDALHRNAAHQQTAASHNNDGATMSPLSSQVLAFHGKNVPAITILSYLSRIHKYCPTTYEVFLSLLVYFDRMTERVNNMVMQAEEARRQAATKAEPSQPPQAAPKTAEASPEKSDAEMHDDESDDSAETDSDLADSDDEEEEEPKKVNPGKKPAEKEPAAAAALAPATYFVVDSFNIHRLIIAGVTCASKFFSDVFYTNSRYAKVGGLPLPELNHLELQFLLLNDFRLSVPVEDLEAYATMLVEFYAREVVAQRARPNADSE